MKRIYIAFALAVSILPKFSHADDQFVEPGRFGVEGGITDDGFHLGVGRATDQYEIWVDFDGSFANRGGSTATSGTDGDIGVDARAGKRFGIGGLNYLSTGVDMRNSLFGHQDGVSTSGTYSVGPYVGFQRYFSGAPVMLNIFVLPYSFNHSVGNDGQGNRVIENSNRFFQQGGVGISLMF